MAEPVRCDVCGKLFSSRHLSSHKRLAHTRQQKLAARTDQDAMKTILELYRNLTAEDKQRVLAELATLAQDPS